MVRGIIITSIPFLRPSYGQESVTYKIPPTGRPPICFVSHTLLFPHNSTQEKGLIPFLVKVMGEAWKSRVSLGPLIFSIVDLSLAIIHTPKKDHTTFTRS